MGGIEQLSCLPTAGCCHGPAAARIDGPADGSYTPVGSALVAGLADRPSCRGGARHPSLPRGECMVIESSFPVKAPPQKVWDFLIDPTQMVGCVPGCSKVERLDDTTYRAMMSVKVAYISF